MNEVEFEGSVNPTKSVRLSVSLKLDVPNEEYYRGMEKDEEYVKADKFFNEFVMVLKNNKDLSSFIVDVLKAYYFEDNIRDAIDTYIADNSPLKRLQKQIDRVITEHSKVMVQTNATHNFVTDEVKRISSNQAMSTPNNDVLDRLAKVESIMSKFENVLDRLILTEKPALETSVENTSSKSGQDTPSNNYNKPILLEPRIEKPNDISQISNSDINSNENLVKSDITELKIEENKENLIPNNVDTTILSQVEKEEIKTVKNDESEDSDVVNLPILGESITLEKPQEQETEEVKPTVRKVPSAMKKLCKSL